MGIKTTTATKFRKFLRICNRCYNRNELLRRTDYITECEGPRFGDRTSCDQYRRNLERAGILERVEPGVYRVLQELRLTTQIPDILKLIKEQESK